MKRWIRIPFLFASAAALAGCDAFVSTLTAPPPESELFVAPDLERNWPAEIAILPVRRPLDFTEAEGVELESELYFELLRKHYTPLDLDFVKKQLPEPPDDRLPDVPSLGRALPADAYLMVDLHKADLENVDSSVPRYRLDGTVFVFESGTGRELYRHDLNVTYDVRLDGSRILPGVQRREKLKLFAGRLLTRLPIRRVR
jgi:hypothetical protein